MRPNNKKNRFNKKLNNSNHSHSIFILLLLIILFLNLIFTSCNTTEPPPIKNGPDTTSQNFKFETHEFGDGFSSSYFNDVWIFNENNIWAVGYIDTDSIANANIMRWNGNEWFIEKYSGTSSGIEGIWALDSTHIYFADGLIVEYKDRKYTDIDFTHLPWERNQRVERLWGSSESNIWGVGPWGTIVHYDGKEWKKIDFDREWRFDDITGNSKTGIAYASATNQQFITIIVELTSSSANIIYNSDSASVHLTAFTLKYIDNNKIYLSDSKIWEFDIKTKKQKVLYNLPSGYGISLTAVYSPNDIYFFGDQFQQGEKMVHYNGVRFKEFNLSPSNSTIFGGAYAIKNLSVMVGFADNKAYLVTIKRE